MEKTTVTCPHCKEVTTALVGSVNFGRYQACCTLCKKWFWVYVNLIVRKE